VRFMRCCENEFCDCAVGGLSTSGRKATIPSSKSRNGPSSARAGLAGRLPGIVSNAVPLLDTTGVNASLMLKSTFDVSHKSKASECFDSADWTLAWRDKFLREPSNLMRGLLGCNDTKESLQDDVFDSTSAVVDGDRAVDDCVKA
jgi:hypothetical protein